LCFRRGGRAADWDGELAGRRVLRGHALSRTQGALARAVLPLTALRSPLAAVAAAFVCVLAVWWLVAFVARVRVRAMQVYNGGTKAPLTLVEKKYYQSGEATPSEGNRFITNHDL
jgi:hypothetical protein